MDSFIDLNGMLTQTGLFYALWLKFTYIVHLYLLFSILFLKNFFLQRELWY